MPVAEVLADLVDALEAADDQALEVELGRDPEVEVLFEVVPPASRTAARSASVARLQHRCLDLDEARRVQWRRIAANDAAAEEEVGARLLVHQQVEVALAVAQLDVGEAVEGVRQRRAVLASSSSSVTWSDVLAAARLGRMARHADHVAEVDVDLGREQLIRPLRSTRSRKVIFPISAAPARARPAGTAATRSVSPGSTSSARARPRRSRPGLGSASATWREACHAA